MQKPSFKEKLLYELIRTQSVYDLYSGILRKVHPQPEISDNYGHWYRKNGSGETYYILRFDTGWGLGAISNQLMLAWNWVKAHGKVPVVWSNCVRNEEKALKETEPNCWDYVFETQISLEDALTKNNVYFSPFDCSHGPWKYPKDLKPYASTMYPGYINSINMKEDLPLYYKYGHEFMTLRKELRDEAQLFVDAISGGKVLGVCMREEFSIIRILGGTNGFKHLEILNRHPFLPTVEECIPIIETEMKRVGAEKIFLSTMFSDTIDIFEKQFGKGNVLYLDAGREIFADYVKNPDEFVAKRRLTLDKVAEAKRYITDCYVLAHCNSIVVPPTGPLRIIAMMRPTEFDNVTFFENFNKQNFDY